MTDKHKTTSDLCRDALEFPLDVDFREPTELQEWYGIGADIRIELRMQFSGLRKSYRERIKQIAERCLELEHRPPVFIKMDSAGEQIQLQETMIASMRQVQKDNMLLREQKNEAIKRAQYFNDELSDFNFKLRQENQKLREALGKALDQLEVFNFAKDPMRVANADTIIREALKGGEG